MASLAMIFDVIARDNASPTLAKVGTEAESTGKKVSGMAKALGALAVIDIGAHMVKAAGEFQQSTNLLVTAAGETQKNLGLIRNGILDIATATGTGIKPLTDGIYGVEKAGYRGADALKVLKAAAQGAREEGADLATVTNAMTSIMASYHLKASDSVSVMNQIKTAAGEAKVTMEQFSGALSTVLPIASANKISFADVAGAMATLTQHGTSADEATQELGFAIRNLSAPNQVAQKEMAQLGISSVDVAQKLGDGPGGRGLTGTMNYLSQTVLSKMGPAGTVLLNTFNQSKQAAEAAKTEFAALPPAAQKVAKAYTDGSMSLKDYRTALKALPAPMASLVSQYVATENGAKGFQSIIKAGGPAAQTYSDAIKKMMGGANGLNVVLQTTGENLAGTEERTKRIADAAKGAGKDVDGWASTQKLFNVQMDQFKESISTAGIRIGTTFLPVLIDVGKALSSAFKFIRDNSAWLTPFVIVLGTAAATIKAITLATKLWTAAQLAWDAAADANPIGIIIVAIAALAAGLIYAYEHSKTFRDVINEIGHVLLGVGKDIVQWAKDFGHWMAIGFRDVVGAGEAVPRFFERMWHDVSKFATNLATDVTHIFDAVAGFFQRHWRLLLVIFTGGIGLIEVVVVNHWKAISGFFARIYGDVVGFVVRIWHDVTGWWGKTSTDTNNIVAGIWHAVAGFFASMWSDVTGWVSRLWRDVVKFFQALATDVWNIYGPFVLRVIGGAQTLWNGVTTLAETLWHTVTGFFGHMRDDVVGVFTDMVTKVGGIWDGIKNLISSPVKWVVETVYDNGILKLWNNIAGILHENWKLDPIHFAQGGVIPGNHRRDDVPFYGTPGEVVVPLPVVSRHGGPHALMSALGFQGTGGDGGHYKGGGVLGTLGSIVGRVAHDVIHPADALGDLAHLARGALGLVAGPAIHGLEGLADRTLGGMGGMGDVMKKVVHSIGDRLLNWITGQDAADASSAPGGFGGPPGTSYPDIIAVMARSGIPFTVNSTTGGGHAAGSYHYMGEAVDFGGDLNRIAAYWMQYAPNLLEEIYSGNGGWFVKNGARVGPGVYSSVIAEHFNHVHVAATDAAMQRILNPAAISAAGAGGVVGQALSMLGLPSSWAPLEMLLVSKESGGNARAHNPSGASGIAQMMPGTFAANMVPGHGDIWNPLDNMLASLVYQQRTYGSPFNIRGLTSGSYAGYDSGGWLMPGYTMAYNGTGKPERVRTAEQEKALGRTAPLVHVENVHNGADLDTWARQAAFLERAGHFA